MPLHRKSALDYAKKYWSRVCDDERVGTLGDLSKPIADFRRSMKAPASEGWEAIFVRDRSRKENGIFRRLVKGTVEDKPFITQDDLEDCTHYVSRCLVKAGIQFTPTSRANELATAMVSHAKTKTLALRTTRDQGQKIIDTGIFKAGDLVAYSKTQHTPFSHTAVFVGKNIADPTDRGGITCHSVCRYRGEEGSDNDEWFLHNDGLFYTLIHFSEDDPPPSHATRKWLPGWWRVRYEYYFITEDGRAFSTSSPPVGRNQRLNHGSSVGYYFDNGREVVFIWRRHSFHVQLERWAASADGTRATVVTNGMPLTVSRVRF